MRFINIKAEVDPADYRAFAFPYVSLDIAGARASYAAYVRTITNRS